MSFLGFSRPIVMGVPVNAPLSVTFISAGAGSSTAAAADLATNYPTGITSGDLLIGHATISSSGGIVNIPSGWTTIYVDRIGSTDAGEHAVFYRYATGSESGTFNITYTNNTAVVKASRVYCFRNVAPSSPIGTTGATHANNATLNGVSVTTTIPRSMAVNLIAVNDDNPLGALSGNTGGVWTKPVAEYTTTAGNDAALGIQVCLLVATGTITGGSLGMGAADPYSNVGFPIRAIV